MCDYSPSKRIVLITGHYGSGKTNVAVNLARSLAKRSPCCILDFDIVNPYFRSADNRDELESLGVRCIIPEYANSNVDVPSLPAEVSSVFCNEKETAVFDVGGDDSGATALAMYSDRIAKAGYEMLYVINMYRPLISEPRDCVALMRDIERSSRLCCTGIVNNSNLGNETERSTIAASASYAEEVCRLSGLPLVFTSVMNGLAGENEFAMSQATKRIF